MRGTTGYQPDTGSRPSGGVITRPTADAARPANPRPVGDVGTGRPGGNSIDSRYRPAPGAERPSPAATGATRPGANPRPSRGDAPAVSNRYPVRDTTPTATRPSATGGAAARPTGSMPTTRPSATATATARPVAPHLGGPRPGSTSSIASGATAHVGYPPGGGYYPDHCHNTVWGGYWDPCHSYYGGYWGGYYGGWCGYYGGWSIGFGCGGFGWGFSLWYPFWYARSCYWDQCYADTYWGAWTQPSCVSAGYWWYPSSVYCPTYLYVPGGVVVSESTVEAGPGTTTEVVSAGSGVVGSARASDAGPGTENLSKGLAIKYVELGDFYFRADRFREAAEAYGKARSYAPDDASVHFVLADAVFADGDYHYAAFLISEGLRLDPRMATAATDKRTFYSDAKVFDAQMAALDAYLAKAPYDAQAHFVRGYNLAFSGKPAAALAAFRRVLEIEPEHRGAQTFAAALEGRPAADATGR